MANICFATLTITRENDEALEDGLVETLRERVQALAYDGFDFMPEREYVEVECGFRWAPPFDELAALSKELQLDIRCTYQERGIGFMGAYRVVNGDVTQEEEISY